MLRGAKSQKDQHCTSLPVWGAWNSGAHRDRPWNDGRQGLGEGGGGVSAGRCRVPAWEDERILEADAHNHVSVLTAAEPYA